MLEAGFHFYFLKQCKIRLYLPILNSLHLEKLKEKHFWRNRRQIVLKWSVALGASIVLHILHIKNSALKRNLTHLVKTWLILISLVNWNVLPRTWNTNISWLILVIYRQDLIKIYQEFFLTALDKILINLDNTSYNFQVLFDVSRPKKRKQSPVNSKYKMRMKWISDSIINLNLGMCQKN